MKDSEFYVVGINRFEKGYAYGEVEDNAVYTKSCDKCPECGRQVGAFEWVRPHNITISNKKLGDFIFGVFGPFAVSEKVKKACEEEGITGISEFCQLDSIRFRNQAVEQKYYVVKPERIDVRPEPVRAEYMDAEEPYCEVCSKVNGSIYSDVWGYKMNRRKVTVIPDLFQTYTNGEETYCTQRFVDFCKKYEFTNFENHIMSFPNYSTQR